MTGVQTCALPILASGNDVTGPVNLGNPGEFTMIELAKLVLELTASKSQLVFQPLPQDDPKQRQPDISVAKAKLGWDVTVPLRAGLERTIDYFAKAVAANPGG